MAGGSVVSRVRPMSIAREGSVQRGVIAIREFQPEDYPALVEIENLLYPDNPTSLAEERSDDDRFEKAGVFRRRLVAEDASEGVRGFALYGHGCPVQFRNVWIRPL